MKPSTYSSRDIICDICGLRSNLYYLLGKEKSYEPVLKELLKLNHYVDEDSPYPSLKELGEVTGLSYGRVRKELRKIYDDILEWDGGNRVVLLFPKVKYILYIRGFRNSLSVDCDHLPVVPRVGEGIELPFFRAKLQTSQFYVERVDHSFTDDTQVITLWLKSGIYNRYYEHKKDEGVLRGEISFREYLEGDERTISEKLKLSRW